MNPEFRQTLQSISRNLESANEVAQENIYTFAQLYIDPCLTGFKACLHDCTAPCFQGREDQLRRKRGRSRGRAELNFDFYDDWDDDDDPGQSLLGWGNDDLDSVLAGTQSQPKRQRPMSYGSRNRRKTGVEPGDAESDPTVIPSSSYFGFLERLPWKLGSKNLRYKPSAADLQENPGGVRIRDVAATEPLIEASDESDRDERRTQGHGRKRSGTAGSRSTTNSLSSRGDLIPSDEEDDAVPLDDEFDAMILAKRTTNSEDHSSGKVSIKRPGVSRTSTRTMSSKSTKSGTKSRRSSSKKSIEPVEPSVEEQVEPPSIVDLTQEEERIRAEQEIEVEQKREAARKLAAERGLASPSTKVISARLTSIKMRANSRCRPQSQTPNRRSTPKTFPLKFKPSPVRSQNKKNLALSHQTSLKHRTRPASQGWRNVSPRSNV